MITAKEAGTLPGLFASRIQLTPDAVAYRAYDGRQSCWRDHSWREMERLAARFQVALAACGLGKGDRIALLLPNGIEWVACDMAAQGLGLVVVPLYAHDSPASSAYILGNCGAHLVLVDTAARWKAIAVHQSQFPALARVWIAFDAATTDHASGHPAVNSLGDVLPQDAGAFDAGAADPRDVATIIYTSGTTGKPKGVMLSHAAILWNAEATGTFVTPGPDDVLLSVLPLAHSFERTVGYYLPMMGGSTIAYARSVQTMRDDLRTVRPTILLAVPRLFERIHDAALKSVEESRLRRWLLEAAVAIGWRRFEAEHGRGARLGWRARAAFAVLDRLVARKFRDQLGGRLRVAVSGGASLPVAAARFFIGLGVPVAEGYGLTEAAPVVTAVALDDNMPGSVGRPLPGLEVRIGDGGELLVRSPGVMLGYWGNEAATALAVDRDGWLRTGDIAEMEDGRVYIRGRLKEIIVLSTGEKINPSPIEAEIEKDTLVKQAMLVGDDRPFASAVLVLDRENWQATAASRGWNPAEPDAGPARKAVVARLDERLADVPRYAKVRDVHLTLTPWTVEAGQLTPTLKIKRKVIAAMFNDAIEALYARHGRHQLLHREQARGNP